MADKRDIVIKVKHGDTLRRIRAYAIGQCKDHDMGKLRVEIISLFKFSADAELILTYTDEDGDQVTLDKDDELRDAIFHQRLNPLKINVKLKPNTGRSAESPELETPVNTQSTDEPPESVPEPVINALSMEETLLKELEAMGFRQIDLNKEILRRNEYNLVQSVDDLHGFAERDLQLSKLHEMGFYDRELNKKVLIKNGGSIKRAVLDLIAGEKPE